MPHEILLPTSCLHCGRKFYQPSPISHNRVDLRQWQEFTVKMRRHLAESHPEQVAKFRTLLLGYDGFLLMSNFQSGDQAIEKQRDMYRWQLHQSTLRARAQNLDKRAAQVAADILRELPNDSMIPVTGHAIIQRHILSVLEELRNVLEEPDLYPDPMTETSQKAAN